MKKTTTYALSLILLFVLVSCDSFAVYEKKQEEKNSKKGWLGVYIQDVTPKLAKSMKLKVDEGALVTSVIKKSPAEKAGVKEEDVIIEFAGKKIGDSDDLTKIVSETKPDSKVKMLVMRGDSKKSLDVTVGTQKSDSDFFIEALPDAKGLSRLFIASDRGMLGLRVSELNEQLADYFGTPDGGVLVEEVEKKSVAQKAGFMAGDVIVKIGRKNVDEVRDIQKVLGKADAGDTLQVEVVRKGVRKTLTPVLEESGDDHSFNFMYDAAPDVKVLKKKIGVAVPSPHVQIYRLKKDGKESKIEIAVPDIECIEDQLECIEEDGAKKIIQLKIDAETLRKDSDKLREMSKKLKSKLQKEIQLKVSTGKGTSI